jgi:hypothetical protein
MTVPVVNSLKELEDQLSQGFTLTHNNSAGSFLEIRFLEVSPIHSRLHRLKELYGAHPATDQQFQRQGSRSVPQNPIGHRDSYQKAFGEMNAVHGMFRHKSLRHFLDIGCSPGGFSGWMLSENADVRGVGITLPDEDAPWNMVVSGTELEGSRYELRFDNIISLTMASVQYDENPVVRCAEDGADRFDVVIAGAFLTGYHRLGPYKPSWRQFKTRVQLVFSQVLVLICNIRAGGNAILVINTKTIRYIVEVIALLRCCFKTITSAKGSRLHSKRSSCYLVCGKFCATNQQVLEHSARLRAALRTMAEIELEEDEEAEGGEPMLQPRQERWQPVPHLFPDLTDEGLFEKEHRFTLDIFEPVWQKQYQAIYADFTKILQNSSEYHEERYTATLTIYCLKAETLAIFRQGVTGDVEPIGRDQPVSIPGMPEAISSLSLVGFNARNASKMVASLGSSLRIDAIVNVCLARGWSVNLPLVCIFRSI